MIFYSDRDDHYSQRVRIVLAEKDISAEIKESNSEDVSDEILSISPYHKLPILVDRDLAIHDPSVMMEYLDERFPHPPLLPVYPVARAQTRLILDRIEKDLAIHLDTLEDEASSKSELTKSKSALEVNLKNSLILFSNPSFFNEEEFTILDAVICPILFRLNFLGINIPNTKAATGIKDYMERIFEKTSFKASLTEAERERFLI